MYVDLYMSEKAQKRSAVNKENRKNNKILSRHGSKSFAASRHEYFENSEDHQYPSLFDTYLDTHFKNGVWLQDEARARFDEMVRLRQPRSDMPADEPCLTEQEILARVTGGKQRGHIPGVGKVVPFLKRPRVDMPPPAPPCTADVDGKLAEAQEKLDEAKKIVGEAQKERKKANKKAAKNEKKLELLTRFMSTNPDWEAFISQAGSRGAAGESSRSGAGGSGAGTPASGLVGESGSSSESGSGSESGSRSGSDDDDQDDDEGL